MATSTSTANRSGPLPESIAVALVWLFNVVGTVDLANALRHVDVVPRFAATWYIPTMLVPLLLVTHFMSFKRLLVRGG